MRAVQSMRVGTQCNLLEEDALEVTECAYEHGCWQLPANDRSPRKSQQGFELHPTSASDGLSKSRIHITIQEPLAGLIIGREAHIGELIQCITSQGCASGFVPLAKSKVTEEQDLQPWLAHLCEHPGTWNKGEVGFRGTVELGLEDGVVEPEPVIRAHPDPRFDVRGGGTCTAFGVVKMRAAAPGG
jgi:hypothetical protein